MVKQGGGQPPNKNKWRHYWIVALIILAVVSVIGVVVGVVVARNKDNDTSKSNSQIVAETTAPTLASVVTLTPTPTSASVVTPTPAPTLSSVVTPTADPAIPNPSPNPTDPAVPIPTSNPTDPSTATSPTDTPILNPTPSHNDGQCWVQLGSDIDGEAKWEFSGWSVAMSSNGDTVAIGSPQYTNNGLFASGRVQVYRYSGSSWLQLGDDIDREACYVGTGWSVSMSSDGGTVAIGAPGNNGDASGSVKVYQYSGSSWVQLGDDMDGEASLDRSGESVSMSSNGRTVAIGADFNDDNGSDSGHVRVYNYTGSSWVQLGSDIDGEAVEDQSGYSVSISADGSTVAIGAPGNDDNDVNSGHVRVYNYTQSSWVQLGSDIDGEALEDQSGHSVSISADGSTVAIGAPLKYGNGSESGHVRVYQYTGSNWIQLGNDIDGEASGDQSGRSVSISADGRIVAIGAHFNDGNGYRSGHVRVFELSGSSWVQLGGDIDGEEWGDSSGRSVSISSDGGTVSIGATGNNVNGADSGHVRVYSYLPCA